MMENLERQEVKGYQLHQILGEGEFGAVYRAYQAQVNREVAIKVIRAKYASQPEFVRRFETEARLIAQLEHLHIVPLYDYWRDPSGAYLVMRMLRGGSLETALKKEGRWSLEKTARLVSQVCAALTVAHTHGVIHQDLKPANLLLDEQSNAYLSDFGIAKSIETEAVQEGVYMGTPAYSAPEQIQSGDVTPLTDIYALGLIIYEVLAGQPPFIESSFSALIVSQLTQQIPSLRALRDDIPRSVDELIRTATAKDPARRFSSAQAVDSAFQQILQKQTGDHPIVADDQFERMFVFPRNLRHFMITPEMLDLDAPRINLVNPYKGLRAFQESDAEDFFGRNLLIRKLLGRMEEDVPNYRFLAVVGPSGSGKSSVVKAGVIPSLRRGALPNSAKYFIAEMVPSVDAMAELESAILSCAINPPTDIHNQLRDSTEGLFNIINEILPNDESEFFLLIDQFEEVFTQTEVNAIRVHFIESLRHAILHPQSRMRAVITIRADFYDKPLLYPEFGALVRERTEVVLPLNHDELEETIVRPAEKAGAIMESGLAERIINEVNEEPGTLPLLQYLLTELFDRRSGRVITLRSYEESGGVLGSLANRAEELYSELTHEEQLAGRQLFLRLVTLGEGTEDTRRRIAWSELPFQAQAVAPDQTFIEDPLQTVLDRYGKARLLTFDRDPQSRERTVEVAHEALIRQWKRLRDWLQNSREQIRAQRRLATAVAEWRKSGEDRSFLADGVRLQQFESLLTSEDIRLTDDERAYVVASVDQREAVARAELERQEHERRLELRAARVLRQLVAVMTVAAIISIGLAVLAYRAQQDAVEQRDQADIARQEAVIQRNQAERQADENFSLQLAARAMQFPGLGDEPLRGIPLVMEANELTDPPSEVLIALAEIAYAPGARRILPHEGWARAVDYSPDGTLIISTEVDGSVRLWDAATGEFLREFVAEEDPSGNSRTLYDLRFSPDGTYVIGAGQEGAAYIWDVQTGAVVHRLAGHRNPVYGAAILPGNEIAVTASEDMRILVWNIADESIEVEMTGHSAPIFNMDVSDDGKWAVTVDFGGKAFVWNLETRQQHLVFEQHQNLLAAVSINPDNQTVLTADQDVLYLWNIETGEVINSLPNPFGVDLIYRVLFSHDGSRFVVSNYGDEFTIFETGTLKQVFANHITGHTDVISGLSFSPDDSILATSAADRKVILWDITGRGAEVARVAPGGALLALEMSGDGSTALYALEDGTLVIWDIQGQTERFRFTPEQPDIFTRTLTADLSSDGQWIVTGDSSGGVILWNAATGEAVRHLAGHQAPVRAVAFSPDGQRIAAAGGNVQINIERPIDNSVMVWETTSGNLLYRMEGHTAPVRALTFSADGTRLLSGGDDSFVYFWDATAGTQIRALSGAHRGGVLTVALSPDGSRALSGGRGGQIVFWNLETGTAIRTMRGRTAPVEALAFSADGQLAVSASSVPGENLLLAWSLERGEIVRAYANHTAPITNMALRSDLSAMISADSSGTVIFWEFLSPEALIDWVYANYDVYCVDGDGFEGESRCIEQEVVTADATETETTQTQLPVPAQSAAQATETCIVTNPSPIPAETIDTSAYRTDAPFVIGFSNAAVTGNPLDAFVGAWAQYEASQHSGEIEQFIYRDASSSAAQQLVDVQEMIDMGVDLLIVNPREMSEADQAAMITLLNSAVGQGIPVIFVNKRLPDVNYVSFVGPDDFEVGCLMTQEFIALMDAEGGYALQDSVTGGASRETRKAARDLLMPLYPNMNPLVELTTEFNIDSIYSNMSTNPDAFEGILAYNGFIAWQSELYMLESGKPLLPAVGDHNIGLARLLYDNNIPGVQIRITGQMGSQAVLTALSVLRGEPVSQLVEIQPEVIRTDALGDYDLSYPDLGMLGDYEGLPEEFYPVFEAETESES